MTEPEPKTTYDGSVGDMAKALINAVVKEAQELQGDVPLDKVRKHMQHGINENTFHGITALSTYVAAKAAERQATALETIAKSVRAQEMAETTDTNAQAIIDQREPKREYLAATFSLDYDTLTFLWALRGILIDASIKSLSRPDRFDPYRKVTNEEIAWTLRITPEQLWSRLPRADTAADDVIDFDLLEAFDVQHYGGEEHYPDEWMYGG